MTSGNALKIMVLIVLLSFSGFSMANFFPTSTPGQVTSQNRDWSSFGDGGGNTILSSIAFFFTGSWGGGTAASPAEPVVESPKGSAWEEMLKKMAGCHANASLLDEFRLEYAVKCVGY